MSHNFGIKDQKFEYKMGSAMKNITRYNPVNAPEERSTKIT